MKKLAIVLLFSGLGMAFQTQAQPLKALFNFKTFYAPGVGPYLETYLSVDARTVQYTRQTDGSYSGAIEISIIVSDATGTKYTDKYNLLSPEVKDSAARQFSFLDQKRIQLPNGTYRFEMTIRDKNLPDKPYNLDQQIKLEYYPNLVAVSDISLIESFSKTTTENPLSRNGYDLVPYVDNFFPTAVTALRFYAEVYNTDQVFSQSPFLLSYYVRSAESGKVIENMKTLSKENPAQVKVLFKSIPLADLPSGNYDLVVEVRDQQNELVASREVAFQRSNSNMHAESATVDLSNAFVSFISDKDTLAEFIRSLRPISGNLETTFLDNQLKLADLKLMQRFFYDFWTKRNPDNPEKAWLEYRAQVIRVNHDFGTSVEKGYETDRGRVYLQYGPPNSITKSYNEPSAYPYEIWHYYRIGNQTNRKFVFYNTDLVSNTFVLLHSDAQGEPFDNQWELKLHKRDTQTHDYDQEHKGTDYFGNQAQDNFINPK